MNDRLEEFKKMLSDLYIAINNNEFTFPEFADKSKKLRKECSLRAHSIMQRYMRQLESSDEVGQNKREAS